MSNTMSLKDWENWIEDHVSKFGTPNLGKEDTLLNGLHQMAVRRPPKWRLKKNWTIDDFDRTVAKRKSYLESTYAQMGGKELTGAAMCDSCRGELGTFCACVVTPHLWDLMPMCANRRWVDQRGRCSLIKEKVVNDKPKSRPLSLGNPRLSSTQPRRPTPMTEDLSLISDPTNVAKLNKAFAGLGTPQKTVPGAPVGPSRARNTQDPLLDPCLLPKADSLVGASVYHASIEALDLSIANAKLHENVLTQHVKFLEAVRGLKGFHKKNNLGS
ncbi:hypothetical protein N7478_008671 [Penicillium angulare]|uniref:uncharacterized protein n=1 Tax=Penicillium angulare TaxID=116970 RepID=UPI0025401495|nr:uncharacterized protein N7478_008671 [Penicillium angulare]KAJ5273546.1 hypothetical protein N7478_008671 [Penicillium angulare]